MMHRILAALKTDLTVQWRNRLYYIGPAVAVITAAILSQLIEIEELGQTIPVTLLLVVGGSTLLYVAGMILFEKDEGTLNALIVSPLTISEYLFSKIVTLTGLASVESIVLIGTTIALIGVSALTEINIVWLLVGILALGVIYTLVGIVMIVRYARITDFLMPALFMSLILQAPVAYFTGLLDSTLFYLIPTMAPTLLISAAWQPLSSAEWLYALGYSAALIIGLEVWALHAFQTHIVQKVG